jgi:hypothetical protein
MTVIVLSKHENHYYMHADGRTSQDWMGIASDNSVKVHTGKDCIYGTCGRAAAKVIVKALLSRTRDPLKMAKLLHHKDFKDILQESSTLVATKKHGCYSINIRGASLFSPKADHSIITWDLDTLPQILGSGFLNVRTLLAQYDKPTPEQVRKAIEDSYKVNHTIGGLISEVKLKC